MVRTLTKRSHNNIFKMFQIKGQLATQWQELGLFSPEKRKYKGDRQYLSLILRALNLELKRRKVIESQITK